MKFILALFLFPGKGDKALQDKRFEDVDGNSAQVGLNYSEKMVTKLGTISETAENRPLPTLGRSSDFKMYPSWALFLKV